MARNKATTTDIYARLAKGECANFSSNSCQGRTPCAIIHGEQCEYFSSYVQPLLEYPEFSQRYHREAKIHVALNPNAKIIRKRRLRAEPALALPTPAPVAPPCPAKKTAAPPPSAPPIKAKTASLPIAPAVKVEATSLPPAPAPVPATPPPTVKKAISRQHEHEAVTTTVTVSGIVRTKPLADPKPRAQTPQHAVVPDQQEFFLELTPAAPRKTKRTSVR
jgi:hypothetical protein